MAGCCSNERWPTVAHGDVKSTSAADRDVTSAETAATTRTCTRTRTRRRAVAELINTEVQCHEQLAMSMIASLNLMHSEVLSPWKLMEHV